VLDISDDPVVMVSTTDRFGPLIAVGESLESGISGMEVVLVMTLIFVVLV
jgi:hypothetical protein